MGRITLFTVDNCLFSRQVKYELEKRNLPYTEISLSKFPEKRSDLFLLTRRMTTPQTFFNTRHVGGCDETLKLLRQWDKDHNFSSPLEKYKVQIESFPDPTNQNLAIPSTTTIRTNTRQEYIHTALKTAPTMATVSQKIIKVNLPDGVVCSYGVWELTKELTKILPLSNLNYHLMTYKNSFKGTDLVTALMKYFRCNTREQAEEIGKQLHMANLIHHVVYEHDVQDTSKYFYRLQYHQAPHILNSLYLLDEHDNDDEDDLCDSVVSAHLLVERLESMLQTLEHDCQSLSDKGRINYTQGMTHPIFGTLQEVICELQSVSISCMTKETLLAFGLNIFNIMLKFAFFKLGFPKTSEHQQEFLRDVKFNIAGNVYSFQEWLFVISEGNIGDEPISTPRRSLIVPRRLSQQQSPSQRSSIKQKSNKREDIPERRSSNGSSNSSLKNMSDISDRSSTSSNRIRFSTRKSRESVSNGSKRFEIADHRLYFAIHYFWSRSSAILHFSEENLDKELDIMALAFCENDANVNVNVKRGELHLSNVFAWYRKDFCNANKTDNMSDRCSASANDKELTNVIFQYLVSPKSLHYRKLLYSGANHKTKILFNEDDWTTNAVKGEYAKFTPSLIDVNCKRF